MDLLAADPLGSQRERAGTPLDPAYLAAFAHIDADDNQELVVAEDAGRIVGTLHLTVLPSLTYTGRARAQIEAVRVHADLRGQGWGRELFEWAIGRARERGCHLVQLTTDKQRPDALAFYEALGFVPSHVGMKLAIG